MSTTDHVGDTAGGAGDDMLAIVEFADVFSDVGAPNTGVTLDLSPLGFAWKTEGGRYVEILAEGEDDRLDLSCEFSSGRKNKGLSFALSSADSLQNGD